MASLPLDNVDISKKEVAGWKSSWLEGGKGKEKKLENKFTYYRTASWLTGMVFSLETLCTEYASMPTRYAGASGCGYCELLHCFRTSFFCFSPATVEQKHQVWAATTQCHSHEEGRQWRGYLRRGSIPDQSHGNCDSAGHHPVRHGEQSKAPPGNDFLLIRVGRTSISEQGCPITLGSAVEGRSMQEKLSWWVAQGWRALPGQVPWSAVRATWRRERKRRHALCMRSSQCLPLVLQDSGWPTSSGKPYPALPPGCAVSCVSLLCVLSASHTFILICVCPHNCFLSISKCWVPWGQTGSYTSLSP